MNDYYVQNFPEHQKKDLSSQQYQEGVKFLIRAQQWPLFKMPEWLTAAIKEYLFVKKLHLLQLKKL